MMVNNSTNKANNHLSPQIIDHCKLRPEYYAVENPGHGWDRHKNVAELIQLMGYQHSLS
jgi:hypothetical protein